MRGKIKRERKGTGKRSQEFRPAGKRSRHGDRKAGEGVTEESSFLKMESVHLSGDSIETACPKCGNLMVAERFIDYQQTGDSAFFGWRCLSCGLILDPLILSRRLRREGEMGPSPEEEIFAGVED